MTPPMAGIHSIYNGGGYIAEFYGDKPEASIGQYFKLQFIN